MAPVMVGDHVTTQVVPLAISTICAARASIKAGVNVRSQRLLSATASEEEAATFRGCYYWKKNTNDSCKSSRKCSLQKISKPEFSSLCQLLRRLRSERVFFS